MAAAAFLAWTGASYRSPGHVATGVASAVFSVVAAIALIGGTDIMALESDAVRRITGLCAQDAHIFDSTLEANLRLARPDASPGELRGTLARARLLDWVDSLPGGLATPVGDDRVTP